MQRASGGSRALTVGIAVLLACAGPATVAQAQQSGFESPSVDQYVESVPTGSGPATTTPGSRGGAREPLPAGARRALAAAGGADRAALTAISSSPSLGAPKATRSGATRRSSTGKRAKPGTERQVAKLTTPPDRGTLAAAGAALGDSGTVSLLVIAALVAATAAMVVLRVRGRRGS
jgi:hypothetical protein